MSTGTSFPTLADAEELYEKAKKCNTPAAITALLGTVNDRIRDYLAVSSTDHSNPATYKTLRNTVQLLEFLDRDIGQKRGLGFKFTKRKLATTSAAPSAEAQKNNAPDQDGKAAKARIGQEQTIDAVGGKINISSLKGADVVRKSEELKDIGTVNIKKLERCRVMILGTVESSYIADVKDSVIWIGISRGAVSLESVVGSTVIVCCSQLRISNSENSTFLIDTVTTPIIEKSSNIVFAKNHMFYSGFPEELRDSGLKPVRLSRHTAIKDFSWHREAQSPNWSIVSPQPSVTLSLQEAQPGRNNVNGNKYTFSPENWDIIASLKQQIN